jgi:hypothetical protein
VFRMRTKVALVRYVMQPMWWMPALFPCPPPSPTL